MQICPGTVLEPPSLMTCPWNLVLVYFPFPTTHLRLESGAHIIKLCCLSHDIFSLRAGPVRPSVLPAIAVLMVACPAATCHTKAVFYTSVPERMLSIPLVQASSGFSNTLQRLSQRGHASQILRLHGFIAQAQRRLGPASLACSFFRNGVGEMQYHPSKLYAAQMMRCLRPVGASHERLITNTMVAGQHRPESLSTISLCRASVKQMS